MKIYIRNNEGTLIPYTSFSKGGSDDYIANLIKTKLDFAVENSSLKIYYDEELFKTVTLPTSSGNTPSGGNTGGDDTPDDNHLVYQLPSSTIFNGINTKIDTGYELFDEDKSFSFIIDFESDSTQPSGQSNLNTTILSCFNDNNHGSLIDIVGYKADTDDVNNTNIRQRILFTAKTSNSESDAISKTNFERGQIYNRQKQIWIYDSETKTIQIKVVYHDGTYETYTGSINSNYVFNVLNYSVVLGCRHINNQYDRYWKGIIYDFKIYDTVLTTSYLDTEFTADINILKQLGCTKINDVKAEYENIENALNCTEGLLFAKNSNGVGGIIRTGITPQYTDTIEISFKTLDTIYTSGAQTLYCTRSNSSQGNSFTTFIITKAIRADYDNPATADSNRYTLSESSIYNYKRTYTGDSLNYSKVKSYKYESTGEYDAVHPLVIGASTGGSGNYANASNKANGLSNYLHNVIVYSLAVKNNLGQYKAYLVACANNRMVDLVSGNVIIADDADAAGTAFNTIEYQ